MNLFEGFKDLFLRIGVDLYNLEGIIALGALFLLIMIIIVRKRKYL